MFKQAMIVEKLFLFLAICCLSGSVFQLWRMFYVSNMCCMAGILFGILFLFKSKYKERFLTVLPHFSVLAYVIVNFLSISIANNFARAFVYSMKLGLVLLGGWFLFVNAISRRKDLKLFYILAAISVTVSVLGCIFFRFSFEPGRFGFVGSSYKYGSYTGMLVPLACVYLVGLSGGWRVWGVLLAAAGIFSVGNAGGIISIFAGLATGLAVSKDTSVKWKILICIVLGAAGFVISGYTFEKSGADDFGILEKDGINLRQRYIEWQAELNLLEARGAAGSGAGSINDYRSKYYYKLPKLNTLEDFDQNGFLAVGAEVGIIGLVCFIWILIYYGRQSFCDYLEFSRMKDRECELMGLANCCGFVSAVVVNIFSSVHYNGILIVFVFILSLTEGINRKLKGGQIEI